MSRCEGSEAFNGKFFIVKGAARLCYSQALAAMTVQRHRLDCRCVRPENSDQSVQTGLFLFLKKQKGAKKERLGQEVNTGVQAQTE